MVTDVEAATTLVVTVNVALVAPAGTVTLPGTVAAELLLDSVTCAPPAGAAPSSVTVPVELLPPVTVVGFTASEVRRTLGITVRVAVRVTPPYDAEMVADVDEVTTLVLIVNVALVAPAATVTLPGTVAAELSLDSVTCAPPAGAGPLRVTVPVAELPPMTIGGLTTRDSSVTAGPRVVPNSTEMLVAS